MRNLGGQTSALCVLWGELLELQRVGSNSVLANQQKKPVCCDYVAN